MKDRLGPDQMIEIWTLRTSGASLKSPCKLSTGGHSGVDRDLVVVRYVEAVGLFPVAEACLDRLREHKDASGLWYRFPGLTLLGSALRRSWGSWFFSTDNKREVPELVLESFRLELTQRIKETPPVFPDPAEPPCPKEQEEALLAEIEEKSREIRGW